MASIELKGGDRLQARLAELAKKIGGGGVVKVGFLEGATYPDGTPVAEIAAIQNYGAPKAKIPARPFFTSMVARNSPAWGVEMASLIRRTNGDGEKALRLMGENIAGQLRQSIVDMNSPPLADVTIKTKGFDKPLVDTGHMLASVDYEVDYGGNITTGNFRPEGMSDAEWTASQDARQSGLRSAAIK